MAAAEEPLQYAVLASLHKAVFDVEAAPSAPGALPPAAAAFVRAHGVPLPTLYGTSPRHMVLMLGGVAPADVALHVKALMKQQLDPDAVCAAVLAEAPPPPPRKPTDGPHYMTIVGDKDGVTDSDKGGGKGSGKGGGKKDKEAGRPRGRPRQHAATQALEDAAAGADAPSPPSLPFLFSLPSTWRNPVATADCMAAMLARLPPPLVARAMFDLSASVDRYDPTLIPLTAIATVPAVAVVEEGGGLGRGVVARERIVKGTSLGWYEGLCLPTDDALNQHPYAMQRCSRDDGKNEVIIGHPFCWASYINDGGSCVDDGDSCDGGGSSGSGSGSGKNKNNVGYGSALHHVVGVGGRREMAWPTLVAMRTIAVGERILLPYGEDYWDGAARRRAMITTMTACARSGMTLDAAHAALCRDLDFAPFAARHWAPLFERVQPSLPAAVLSGDSGCSSLPPVPPVSPVSPVPPVPTAPLAAVSSVPPVPTVPLAAAAAVPPVPSPAAAATVPTAPLAAAAVVPASTPPAPTAGVKRRLHPSVPAPPQSAAKRTRTATAMLFPAADIDVTWPHASVTLPRSFVGAFGGYYFAPAGETEARKSPLVLVGCDATSGIRAHGVAAVANCLHVRLVVAPSRRFVYASDGSGKPLLLCRATPAARAAVPLAVGKEGEGKEGKEDNGYAVTLRYYVDVLGAHETTALANGDIVGTLPTSPSAGGGAGASDGAGGDAEGGPCGGAGGGAGPSAVDITAIRACTTWFMVRLPQAPVVGAHPLDVSAAFPDPACATDTGTGTLTLEPCITAAARARLPRHLQTLVSLPVPLAVPLSVPLPAPLPPAP